MCMKDRDVISHLGFTFDFSECANAQGLAQHIVSDLNQGRLLARSWRSGVGVCVGIGIGIGVASTRSDRRRIGHIHLAAATDAIPVPVPMTMEMTRSVLPVNPKAAATG